MAKKRLAFVTQSGHFSDVARHITNREGIETGVFIKEKFWQQRLDGVVNKFKSIEEIEKFRPDAILIEYTGMDSEYNRLSKQFPVFNGLPAVTKLEEDRKYGLSVMKQYGIEIPRTIAFNNIPDAMTFLKENKKTRFVFKQDQSDVSALTMVEKVEGTLIKDLERIIEMKQLKASTPCLLQEVAEGVEFDVEVWVQNGRIILPGNCTVEEKKPFAGDLGASCGAAAAFVFADSKDGPSEVAKRGILKLAPWLEKTGYTGQLSMNSIVTKDNRVLGLEWTTRVGINASYLLLPLLSRGWGDTLITAAKGELKEMPILADRVCAGLIFTVYPFPIDLKEEVMQKKVMEETCTNEFIGEADGEIFNNESIFLGDVWRHKNELLCAGTDGLLAFNARSARSVGGAIDDALGDSKFFRDIPNIQWKTSGVERAFATIRKMANQGMLDDPPDC